MAIITFGPHIEVTHGDVCMDLEALLDDRHDQTIAYLRVAVMFVEWIDDVQHPVNDAWFGGGGGPFRHFKGTFEDFVDVHYAEGIDDMIVRRRLKTPLKKRRQQFNTRRDRIYQTMILAGHEEFCVFCGRVDDITIDHIHPLSKGGSDDLDNLQFLCRPCNSAKGNR